MKNLLVDLGNTSAKIAFSEQGQIGEVFRCSKAEEQALVGRLLSTHEVGTLVLSSVREIPAAWEEFLTSQVQHYIRFDAQTQTMLKNAYQTPHTLGADRLAAAVGAQSSFPDRDLLIFDFGTAITIDRLTHDGIFCGGNISLGLSSRFRALHEFTGKLPLLSSPEETGFLGTSTQEAIQQGVASGIIFEVEGYIRRFPDHVPIFTGGDAFYFAEKMKTPIFAVYNLVLTGLARVAERNAI